MNIIFKFIIFLLIPFSLLSCGEGDLEFDYTDKYNTMYLEVEPQTLQLDKDNKTGSFIINYPFDKLFMTSISIDDLTDNFKITLDENTILNPEYCVKSIETTNRCVIPIEYTPTGYSSHTGRISLFFAYNEDKVEAGIKEHVLTIKGNNKKEGSPEGIEFVLTIPDPIELSLTTTTTIDIKIAITPQDATCTNLTFSSEAPTIATFDKVDDTTGRVTAKQQGETKIKVDCDGMIATATVKVDP